MPIRAVLFDKDGTLLDYHRTWGPINLAAAEIAARTGGVSKVVKVFEYLD